MNKERLKRLVAQSLRQQGFRIRRGRILAPADTEKTTLRRLHSHAVMHLVARAGARLAKYEAELLQQFASGCEINPDRIRPRLVQVHSRTRDELLFRYASLHWSIPVSSGYGRRLRFLVVDEDTSKLIGLFGLCDPVFSVAARDTWIGWSSQIRRENLYNVMDAFVLGAVPPYSMLLAGKLVAMLTTSNPVREIFEQKYAGRKSLIRGDELDPRLALITTTSALGRSSLYNRLSLCKRRVFESVGYTRGSGGFHFSNGLYAELFRYATRYCKPTAKRREWGTGFRNRREVVKKCLSKIGLSGEWVYHGVQREVFAASLAENSREFLRGEESILKPFAVSVDEIAAFFKERWLLPRSRTNETYRHWYPEQWRLWKASK